MIGSSYSIVDILLRVILPVAFCAAIFKWAERSENSQNRAIDPFFTARLLSSAFFCIVVYAFPRSGQRNYLSMDLSNWFSGAALTLLLSVLAIGVSYRASQQASHLKVYPQVRSSNWTLSLHLRNGLTWAIYLFGYEIFFRGFLLYSALEVLPLRAAVAVNLVVYSAAHFHKGLKESVMSIPFGLLLCLITLYTGNVWSAFIIHASLALSSDRFAILQTVPSNQDKTMFRL